MNTRRPPKVMMVKFANGRPSAVEDVITGFQRSDGSRFARPSGALMGPDGNFYFTSDGGDIEGLFRLRLRTAETGTGTGDTGEFKAVPIYLLLNRDRI